MRFAVVAVLCLSSSFAFADPQPIAVKAFHSGKCLANIGKAGVAPCHKKNELTLLPVGHNKVMLRAHGNHCLYANRDGRFAWYGCTPSFEDQHWELIAPDRRADAEVKNPADGYRMLKSVHAGTCLFSNKDGRFGLYTCTQKFSDQFWRVGEVEAPRERPARHAKTAATPQPMADADFQKLVAAIQAESFSADQLGALELGKRGKAFSVAQVGTLIDLFSFSADKIAALKAVREQIVDRDNEVQLLERFTFSADKAEARKILSQ